MNSEENASSENDTPVSAGEATSSGEKKRTRRRRPRHRRRRPGGVAAVASVESAGNDPKPAAVQQEAATLDVDPVVSKTAESREVMDHQPVADVAAEPGTGGVKKSRRRRGGRSRHRSKRAEGEAPAAGTAVPGLEPIEAVSAPVSDTPALAGLMNRLTAKTASPSTKSLKFPGIDTARARKILLPFIHDQMERFAAQHAVLGFSGGLDSTTTAALLAEALGREKVMLVFFLEPGSGESDRHRANDAARWLKCPLQVLDLRPQFQSLQAGGEALSGIRLKNRVARERMAVLYDMAEAKSGLVAGAYNKTKWLLGEGTEHGDLAFAFNPLGDLYRSQVFELACALNIHRAVLDQAQRSQGLQDPDVGLALTWPEIDYYLHQVVDAKLALSHLQTAGISERVLRGIYRRLRDSAHKRMIPLAADATGAYLAKAWEPKM